MKLTLLLMLLAGPAFAGGGSFFGPGGGDGASSSTGTHTDGASASFKNATAETLASTGTAPSLTATGAVFTGSVTVTGSNNLRVGGGVFGLGSPSGIGNGIGIKLGSNGSTAGLAYATDNSDNYILMAVDSSELRLNTQSNGPLISGTGYSMFKASATFRCGDGATARCPIGFASSGYAVPTTGGLGNGDKLSFFDTNGLGTGEKYVMGLESGYMWFQQTGSVGGFKWYKDATASMTLNEGSLGIGTASPAFKLHLSSGSIYVDGNVNNPVSASTWTATYTGGSAHVCVNNSGVLFISEAACP